MYMHIHTIEEDYEYRMKNIIKAFVKDYGLNELNPEELQYKIWTDYAKEFAHVCQMYMMMKNIEIKQLKVLYWRSNMMIWKN